MHDRSYINHRHVTMSRSLKPLYTPGTKYVFMFLYDIFLEFFFFVFETFDACFVPPSEPHPSVWNRCPQKTKRKLCRQKQLLGMNVSSTSSTATNASFFFAYERRIYHTAKTIPKAFFACGKTGTIIAHFICFHPMSNNGGELIKQTGCATKLQTQIISSTGWCAVINPDETHINRCVSAATLHHVSTTTVRSIPSGIIMSERKTTGVTLWRMFFCHPATNAQRTITRRSLTNITGRTGVRRRNRMETCAKDATLNVNPAFGEIRLNRLFYIYIFIYNIFLTT